MALPLRPRIVPQCSACLRRNAFAALVGTEATALRQQIRGKKKMPNNSRTLTVKLLKDVKGYGRPGALVPVSRGAMRNDWFPRRIAEYVTQPELKRLRLNNVAMERDHQYLPPTRQNTTSSAMAEWQKDIPGDIKGMTNAELRQASALEREKRDLASRLVDVDLDGASAFQKAAEVEKLTPERSMELVEIFVPPRLDFYRQTIVDEKEVELPVTAPERPSFGGIAGDLMAARAPMQPDKSKEKPLSIYGSVSTQDILTTVRAVMGNNDEAARVVLHEDEIRFTGLPDIEDAEAGRLKHLGEYSVEIRLRGMEKVVHRVVRVVAQES